MYVVVVLDKKLNSRYVLECVDGERPKMIVENTSPNLKDMDLEALGRFGAKNIGKYWNVILSPDEVSAKKIASEFASIDASKNVFWGKLMGAFESVPSKPIEKVVSDKGVLPV